MSKQVSADGYIFDFSDDIIDAFVFDSPEYHDGLQSMKAVDIIAEFPQEYLYIELKKYDPDRGGIQFRCPLWGSKSGITKCCPLSKDDEKRDLASVKRIAQDLRRKYSDTFLYRYAEDKTDKPVNYICVVEGCDSALINRLHEILKHAIPKGIVRDSWKRPIVKNIVVVNIDNWNKSDSINRYGHCSLVENG